MTTANIVFLIDIQNGFAAPNLTAAEGGSLYVPQGETVGVPAARLLSALSGSIVFLSQDYHPADHISFASNHPGKAPFSDINLVLGADQRYHANDELKGPSIKQTLWLDHCIQGTKSALFVDEIMRELPADLSKKLAAQGSEPALSADDARNNQFIVIRKGTRSDLDSYGIAYENDRISATAAPSLFHSVGHQLRGRATRANIFIGGLATNYCVAASHRDVIKLLVPRLNSFGIHTQTYLLSDMSAGIPLNDGSKHDLAVATQTMKDKGSQMITTDEAIALIRPPMPSMTFDIRPRF